MDEILKKSNGANFFLSDLHIHTPSDQCKKYDMQGVDKRLDDENWCRQYIQEMINEAYKKKIEVIGITDHNSVEWIDYFNDEIKKITPPKGQKEITIFPGFEINCPIGNGIHVICLFEPGSKKNKLEGYLSTLY